jgi:hypothetical protein
MSRWLINNIFLWQININQIFFRERTLWLQVFLKKKKLIYNILNCFQVFSIYINIYINIQQNSFRERSLIRFEECREDFSKNEALIHKLNCMMRNVFICMLVSNRRTFRLRQNANVMKISIMFSTKTRISSRVRAFSYQLNEERLFQID